MNRRQQSMVAAMSLVVAASRLAAVAKSPFDWDEGLFAMAVADYDVAEYRPHPPGYPLYIAAAKAFHAFGLDEFRSLQAVVLVGGVFIFPSLFWLAREIGYGFTTSFWGATMFAFLPNVWVYGGTAFSDVPSAATVFAACALLLRGRDDNRSYLAGALALAIAAGIRPSNLLVGAFPALLSTRHRLKSRAYGIIAAALVTGVAVVAGIYAGAAFATSSPEAFLQAAEIQSDYVRRVDSWRSPGRPPLREVAQIFWIWPISQKPAMGLLAALALTGAIGALVRRRWSDLMPLAIFGPLMIVAWLNLDFRTASRYAIGYMAVHTLLAAAGLRVIGRSSRLQAILAAALVLTSVIWTWPGLRVQRTSTAPPYAALEWVEQNVGGAEPLYVQASIQPIAEFVLGERDVSYFGHLTEISINRDDPWIVDMTVADGSHSFVWPRNALWDVLRRRNFESSIRRVSHGIHFGNGWYAQESADGQSWRWMAEESETFLPARGGDARLYIRGHLPVDAVALPIVLEVYLNEMLIERIVTDQATVERSWIAPARDDAPNILRLRTSGSVDPSRRGHADTRRLGFRLDALSWRSAR